MCIFIVDHWQGWWKAKNTHRNLLWGNGHLSQFHRMIVTTWNWLVPWSWWHVKSVSGVETVLLKSNIFSLSVDHMTCIKTVWRFSNKYDCPIKKQTTCCSNKVPKSQFHLVESGGLRLTIDSETGDKLNTVAQ